MKGLPNILPANRVAAITTWLTGLAAFITGITSTLPSSWQNAAIGIGGLITSLASALVFMIGAQKSEALDAMTWAKTTESQGS